MLDFAEKSRHSDEAHGCRRLRSKRVRRQRPLLLPTAARVRRRSVTVGTSALDHLVAGQQTDSRCHVAQKWSKGKLKEKVNNLVLFDQV